MMNEQSLGTYLEALASKAGTPGGGAVAAVNGAQGAALIAMVCRLSKGHDTELETMTARADDARHQFMALADADMTGFREVMRVWKLPKTDRERLLPDAVKQAMQPPLDTMELSISLVPDVQRLHEIGNRNLVTDTGIAAVQLAATIRAARQNILVNLQSVNDAAVIAGVRTRIEASNASLTTADALAKEIEAGLHTA